MRGDGDLDKKSKAKAKTKKTGWRFDDGRLDVFLFFAMSGGGNLAELGG